MYINGKVLKFQRAMRRLGLYQNQVSYALRSFGIESASHNSPYTSINNDLILGKSAMKMPTARDTVQLYIFDGYLNFLLVYYQNCS